MENLFNLWAKRNPSWEKRYEDSIMGAFTDYGKRYSQFIDTRGKIFGPGYEIFIIAFFIGLYSNQTKPLTEDKSKVKTFGYAIMYWGGNEDIKLGRVSYKMLQEYMFAALIARTDIDFIALDKGDISPRTVVDKLVEKMEEYANFGFDYIQQHMEEQPDCFFKDGAFMQLFLEFLKPKTEGENPQEDDEPEDF